MRISSFDNQKIENKVKIPGIGEFTFRQMMEICLKDDELVLKDLEELRKTVDKKYYLALDWCLDSVKKDMAAIKSILQPMKKGDI